VIKQGGSMKVFLISTKVLLLLIIAFFVSNQIYGAEDLNKQINILWEREFDVGGSGKCFPITCVFDKTANNLNIIVSSYLTPNESKDKTGGKIWLWKIDANAGKEIKRVVIKENYDNIVGARTLENSYLTSEGDIYALGEFEGTKQSLIKITGEGKIVFIKSTSEIFSEEVFVKQMLSLSNGNFLFIGNNIRGNRVVVKVDKDRKIVWEKIYELDNIGILTDGILINDKEDFLIVCESVGDPALFSNPEVRMIWCDSKGNILSEEIFSGYFAQLCQLGSGEIVVLYADNIDPQNPFFGAKNYKIRIYTPQFKLLSEKQIAEGHFLYPSLKIKSFSTENFIVGGCKEIERGKLSARMDGYSKEGNKLFTWAQELPFCFKFLLTSSENKLFIITQKSLMIKEKKLYPLMVNVKCIEVKN